MVDDEYWCSLRKCFSNNVKTNSFTLKNNNIIKNLIITKSKILKKEIIYCGSKCLLVCDGRCYKAWGLSNRPKIFLSDNEDDFVWLSDNELGEAPEDPGTSIGGIRKDPKSLNKWCADECERSRLICTGETDFLRDFSKRVYNIKAKGYIPTGMKFTYQKELSLHPKTDEQEIVDFCIEGLNIENDPELQNLEVNEYNSIMRNRLDVILYKLKKMLKNKKKYNPIYMLAGKVRYSRSIQEKQTALHLIKNFIEQPQDKKTILENINFLYDMIIF